MSLIFDIETVGERNTLASAAVIKRAGEAGEEASNRLGLSPWTGSVAVAAFWDTDKGEGVCLASGYVELPSDIKFRVICCEGEGELVAKAWRIISSRSQLVSWNGIDFDVPFLLFRAMVHGVQVSTQLLDSKPWESRHVDLMQKTKAGFRGAVSLEVACLGLGIDSPKGDINGAGVEAAWRGGRQSDVAQYCCGDVLALLAVWNRWQDATSG